MRARKVETARRQEQIADAAMRVIRRCGVGGLSIAGIAEQVGIVPSAVYRHYRGKDAVLDAVLDLLERRLAENVAVAREAAPDALGQLQSLLTRHVRLVAENLAIPQVVFSDGVYAGDPARKERVRAILCGYMGEVQEMVRAGQREGTIRRDLNPQTAAVMFLGMVMPAAVLWSLSGGAFDVAAHVENAWPPFRRSIAVSRVRASRSSAMHRPR